MHNLLEEEQRAQRMLPLASTLLDGDEIPVFGEDEAATSSSRQGITSPCIAGSRLARRWFRGMAERDGLPESSSQSMIDLSQLVQDLARKESVAAADDDLSPTSITAAVLWGQSCAMLGEATAASNSAVRMSAKPPGL